MHRARDCSGKLIGSCVHLLSTSRSLSTLIILLHRRMKKLWPPRRNSRDLMRIDRRLLFKLSTVTIPSHLVQPTASTSTPTLQGPRRLAIHPVTILGAPNPIIHPIHTEFPGGVHLSDLIWDVIMLHLPSIHLLSTGEVQS